MRTIWRVTETGLVPTDDDAWEALRAHPIGTEVVAEPHGARNPKQLRLWWALCGIVAEHFHVVKVSISDDVKIALGHTQTIEHWDGRKEIKAASIKEESLSQSKFNTMLTMAIDKMSEWMGSAPADLRRRFDEVSADKRYEGMRR